MDEPRTGSLLGVEHEYRILGPDGDAVDFRHLLPVLPVAGRALDPADRYAIRLPWGAVLTADAAEAEVALPPLVVRRGTAGLATSLAARALAELEDLLPVRHTVDGYSTHISIAMPTDVADAAAELYVRTFAPALMLLLDGRDAPGLLVRPRPGRLELGGDFRVGAGLTAALVFALGSALATARAVREAHPRALPPVVEVRAEPAVERYGWYVDRTAFAADLYSGGRTTPLRLRRGGTIAAGVLLAQAWAVARRELRGRATRAELRLVDELVTGHRPLPTELAAGVAGDRNPRAVAQTVVARSFRAPEGHLLDDIIRPGFTLRATLATWELAIFEVTGARRAIVAVPRRELGAFLTWASTGMLDGPLARFLAHPSRGDVLCSRTDALAGTRAWDGIGDPRALIADEPDGTGRGSGTDGATEVGRVLVGGVRVATAAGRLAGIDLDGPDLPGDRPGKRSRRLDQRRDDRADQHHDASPRPKPRQEAARSVTAAASKAGVPFAPIAAGIVAVVGIVAVLVVSNVLGGGMPSSPEPSLVAAAAGGPSASPDASAIAVPAASVSPTPPPLGLARVVGTYNNGADDSYLITVAPACAEGACDGTAQVMSLPFEADGPRASVAFPFVDAAGIYSGEGTGPVPVCRTADGAVLTASPTYRLDGFRPTAQALVDGQWIATAIAGTITVGPVSTAVAGTTCSSSGSSQAVALGWQDPAVTPTPIPTEPPLDQARFDGDYSPKGFPDTFRVAASCTEGPCPVNLTMQYWMETSAKRMNTLELANDGTGWTGSSTFKDLRCSNGAHANVTVDLRDLRTTRQELIDGVWTATRLEGAFVRKKFKQFSGPGCTGETQSSKLTLNRNP